MPSDEVVQSYYCIYEQARGKATSATPDKGDGAFRRSMHQQRTSLQRRSWGGVRTIPWTGYVTSPSRLLRTSIVSYTQRPPSRNARSLPERQNSSHPSRRAANSSARAGPVAAVEELVLEPAEEAPRRCVVRRASLPRHRACQLVLGAYPLQARSALAAAVVGVGHGCLSQAPALDGLAARANQLGCLRGAHALAGAYTVSS